MVLPALLPRWLTLRLWPAVLSASDASRQEEAAGERGEHMEKTELSNKHTIPTALAGHSRNPDSSLPTQ